LPLVQLLQRQLLSQALPLPSLLRLWLPATNPPLWRARMQLLLLLPRMV
jgi:hypothetical protein